MSNCAHPPTVFCGSPAELRECEKSGQHPPPYSIIRIIKWGKYHEKAVESAESDSNLENVDITESESDEEDPLADTL